MTKLILSPHFDDAVFSLGGMIAANPKDCIICTIFAGTPPEPLTTKWDTGNGFKDSTESMEARIRENESALTFLGVEKENIIDWDFLDNQYRTEPINKFKLADILKGYICRVSEQEKDLQVYCPIALRKLPVRHCDHDELCSSFRIAIDTLGDLGIEFYFYEDQPYVNMSKDQVKNGDDQDFIWDMVENEYGLTMSKDNQTGDWEKKIKAAKMYASQYHNGLYTYLAKEIETSYMVGEF